MISRPLLLLFLLWCALDVICLVIGVWQSWFFGMGVRGLMIDLILGVLILGQYLRDTNRL